MTFAISKIYIAVTSKCRNCKLALCCEGIVGALIISSVEIASKINRIICLKIIANCTYSTSVISMTSRIYF